MVMWKCMPSHIVPGGTSSGYNQYKKLSSNDQPHQLPRVKLTGSGKMPVMDMRSNNIVQNYANIPQAILQTKICCGKYNLAVTSKDNKFGSWTCI